VAVCDKFASWNFGKHQTSGGAYMLCTPTKIRTKLKGNRHFTSSVRRTAKHDGQLYFTT